MLFAVVEVFSMCKWNWTILLFYYFYHLYLYLFQFVYYFFYLIYNQGKHYKMLKYLNIRRYSYHAKKQFHDMNYERVLLWLTALLV